MAASLNTLAAREMETVTLVEDMGEAQIPVTTALAPLGAVIATVLLSSNLELLEVS